MRFEIDLTRFCFFWGVVAVPDSMVEECVDQSVDYDIAELAINQFVRFVLDCKERGLQDEDEDVVGPETEVGEFVVDPAPYTGPYIELTPVHSDPN